MRGKCYPLANDFLKGGQQLPGAKISGWHILTQFSPDGWLLGRTVGTVAQYAPLYVHSFRPVVPCRLLDMQTFTKRYRCYEDSTSIPDKLRYARGWMQTDVARRLEVSNTVYKSCEKGEVEHISIAVADRLAVLYGVPVTDFLDDYSRFLHGGQSRRIRACREALGLTRAAFAQAFGIPEASLQNWEAEKKKLSYRSWERYFEGR